MFCRATLTYANICRFESSFQQFSKRLLYATSGLRFRPLASGFRTPSPSLVLPGSGSNASPGDVIESRAAGSDSGMSAASYSYFDRPHGTQAKFSLKT